MKNYKFLFLTAFISLLTLSCENDNSIEDDSNSINFSKTKIILDSNKTIITTENSNTDFSSKEVIISKNVLIKDGFITSKSKNNLWFVPFDKDESPILINKTYGGGGDPTIEINCDCSSGTVGSCEETDTPNGNNTIIVTCVGACIDPDEPETHGTCDMSLILTQGKNSTSFSLINGIIVSSKELVFNNKVFN